MNFVIGDKDPVNRKAVENPKIDILISPERSRKKDFMKSRNSGLNQVLAKLAHKNDISIGFDFNYALNTNGKERSNLLGKMMLNVKLCSKYKVKIIICNNSKKTEEIRSEDNLKSFGRILGITNPKVKIFEY